MGTFLCPNKIGGLESDLEEGADLDNGPGKASPERQLLSKDTERQVRQKEQEQ